MCSVVGYVGSTLSRSKIVRGLERLEYRGYDSAGFACLNPINNQIDHVKAAGGLDKLISKCSDFPFDGFLGIGHTRWSTHGASTAENAHPHFDCQKTIALVHNGIIENYRELKSELEEHDHAFASDTDTEIIAHLLEQISIQEKNRVQVMLTLVNKLKGAYSIAAIHSAYPDTIIAVRKSSPLCVGRAEDGMYVASDELAFAGHVEEVFFMPDESFAFISKNNIELYDFKGNSISCLFQKSVLEWSSNTKQGYEHYMIKEIYEQKAIIVKTVDLLKNSGEAFFEHLGLSVNQIQDLESVVFIGCGTSYNAGRIAQFFFDALCSIRCEAVLASEYRGMNYREKKNTLYMAISQSGETADTLEVIRLLKKLDLFVTTLTNVASSSMVRETDGFLLTHAGPEIAVASTKSFSAQITILFWLAHKIAFNKKLISQGALDSAENDLLYVAEILENSIEKYKQEIKTILAPRYAEHKQFIFLGRHISFPFALEAALKLKEIAYKFVDCYPSGELKHGPIALVDKDTPIFIFSVIDPILYQKLVANAQEVKARSGRLVVFAFDWQAELLALADTAFVFPKVNPLLAPLAMTGLMQYFVYEIALYLKLPIDKPRNLAKSVTVE